MYIDRYNNYQYPCNYFSSNNFFTSLPCFTFLRYISFFIGSLSAIYILNSDDIKQILLISASLAITSFLINLIIAFLIVNVIIPSSYSPSFIGNTSLPLPQFFLKSGTAETTVIDNILTFLVMILTSIKLILISLFGGVISYILKKQGIFPNFYT